MIQTEHLTALGNRVEGALTWQQLEFFAAPHSVTVVQFETHEVTALCPVTNQPDLYSVDISYAPAEWCVESKTLKLFLMQWRNTGIFGEAIADRICEELNAAIQPKWITVVARQQVRGGLQMTTTARRG